MKKIFILTLILFIAIMSSIGCTSLLWQKKVVNDNYNELVDGFFVNQEKSKIVILGQKYHYILSMNEEFLFCLQHYKDNGIIFHLDQGKYSVRHDEVTVALSIEIDKTKASDEVLRWAEHYALSRQNKIEYDVASSYIINFNIAGKRYFSDPKVNEKLKIFQQPITLKVKGWNYEKETFSSVTYKVVMTPFAVALDIIGTLVAIPVAVVILSTHK